MNLSENKYSSILANAEAARSRSHRRYIIVSWLRLVLFVAALLSIYMALTRNQASFWFILTGISVILLVSMVYLSAATAAKRDYFARLKSLAAKELDALNFNFLSFPDGADLIDSSHPYSSDIDLFGQGSVYQYLNRTVTPMGRQRLVDWLETPCLDAGEIQARQESCREVSAEPDWRLNFTASGYDAMIDSSRDNLFRWSVMPDLFMRHSLWLKFIKAWQAAAIILVIAVISGLAGYQLLILLTVVNLAITGAYIRKIGYISRLFDNSFKQLDVFKNLIRKINDSPFSSAWISERINALGIGENSAAVQIGNLHRLLGRFDSRNNILVGFVRDALFLTDISLVIKMEMWRKNNRENISLWLDALGDADAMNSLATYAYNNPGYCYPHAVQDAFCLDCNGLGHPLIHPGERVCNPFSINNLQILVVLTGANMAGKSTFLRTVGINHVLAHMGAPVCATSYRFSPVSLITSIRTNDSLIKHESYFYAELKKLKHIVETLEKGEAVFILLDEVLKGTNSNDKLNGSRILVSKLLSLRTSGIIATHDVALGEMENEFPGKIVNRCFEAQIVDDQLVFDYKLQDGTARNMTALFLMKQMKIV